MLPMFNKQTPYMSFKRILLLPAIILFFITACQPVQGPHTRPQPTQIDTLAAEQEGDFARAAAEYLALANTAEGEKQALLLLRAARLFWQVEQTENSQQALTQLNDALLSPQHQFDASILRAELALNDNQGEAALKAVANIDEEMLSAGDSEQLYQIKVDAYALTENWLEKANTHLKLDTLLAEQTALETNRAALWQTLLKLTPQALDLFNPGIPPADDSGCLLYTSPSPRDRG